MASAASASSPADPFKADLYKKYSELRHDIVATFRNTSDRSTDKIKPFSLRIQSLGELIGEWVSKDHLALAIKDSWILFAEGMRIGNSEQSNREAIILGHLFEALAWRNGIPLIPIIPVLSALPQGRQIIVDKIAAPASQNPKVDEALLVYFDAFNKGGSNAERAAAHVEFEITALPLLSGNTADLEATMDKVAKAQGWALIKDKTLPRFHSVVKDLGDEKLDSFRSVNDEPVDLDRLRADIRNKNDLARISSRMTVQDFHTLIDEFPDEKVRIGDWATTWAKNRPLKIDPSHPYFEIFTEAFLLKDQLDGQGCSGDYTTYSINDEGYWLESPPFPYLIYSSMGFQELSRPENRELIRKLDNQTDTCNPAYRYASALSKIFTYRMKGDGPNKLYDSIGSLWEAYNLAKGQKLELYFFKTAFRKDFCYDPRVMALQEFSESLLTV